MTHNHNYFCQFLVVTLSCHQRQEKNPNMCLTSFKLGVIAKSIQKEKCFCDLTSCAQFFSPNILRLAQFFFAEDELARYFWGDFPPPPQTKIKWSIPNEPFYTNSGWFSVTLFTFAVSDTTSYNCFSN